MQQYRPITDIISDMIKTTLSEDINSNVDELINIANYINMIITKKQINDDNIHCVLKLISNRLLGMDSNIN